MLGKQLAKHKRSFQNYGHVVQQFGPYINARKRGLSVAFALTIVQMLMRLLEPWPLKLILDYVLIGAPMSAAIAGLGFDRIGLLYVMITAIALIALARGASYYFYRQTASRLGQEIAAELRLDLYSHIQSLSFAFHTTRRTGDILVRLTSDIRSLRQAFVTLPLRLSDDLLLLIGMSAVMLWMQWELAAIGLLLLPFTALMVRRYKGPLRDAIRKQRRREGHLASVAAESLGAFQVVQGFRRERDEVKRFGSANRKSLRSGVRAARLEAKMHWASEVAIGLATAAVIAFAAQRILAGTMMPGDLIVFVSYLKAFTTPLRRISRTTERIVRASAAGERVLDILRNEPDVADAENALRARQFNGEVSFENVSFRHGNDTVLHNINLKIAASERIGIVGPTGSGKTSLIGLIPRFYDPQEGRVLIDGQDIRTLSLDSLRRQISIVFQEPLLFGSTIAQNIAVGKKDATREEVERAALAAGIDPVIRSLPEGYDTVLGERGTTLSGGQRQCVAIARAILRDARIVLMDEPMTGLDVEAVVSVSAAMESLMAGRTVFMISHDMAHLSDMERIIRIEDGRVVSHDDMLVPHQKSATGKL